MPRPVVIEAAINGFTTKATNPNVRRSVDEIATTAAACVDAGASIVHNHNDEPNLGEPSVHSRVDGCTAWACVASAPSAVTLDRSCTG